MDKSMQVSFNNAFYFIKLHITENVALLVAHKLDELKKCKLIIMCSKYLLFQNLVILSCNWR